MDGKNGIDGVNGKDGVDGKNGVDGVNISCLIKAGENIHYGDICCINKNAVFKINSGKWNSLFYKNEKCISVLHDNYIFSVNETDKLTFNVNNYDGSPIANILISNEINKKAFIHKINNEDYVVVFGSLIETKNIEIIKFSFDGVKLFEKNKITVDIDTQINTFATSYETNDLNSICCLFYVSGKYLSCVFVDIREMLIGYKQEKINSIDFLHDGTLSLLHLQNQTIVCAYTNVKCFIMLPVSYKNAPTIGDTIIDGDSYDCACISYDVMNGVILSVERMISDMIYLQVLDIFGSKINIIKSKKINSLNIKPLHLCYNEYSCNFILIYNTENNIYGHIFTNDGDNINIKTRCKCPDVIDVKSHVLYVSSKYYEKMEKISITTNDGKTYFYNFQDNCNEISTSISADTYIGISNCNTNLGDNCEIILKGNIFVSNVQLDDKLIGRHIYISGEDKIFPDNLTVESHGNFYLGICINNQQIILR